VYRNACEDRSTRRHSLISSILPLQGIFRNGKVLIGRADPRSLRVHAIKAASADRSDCGAERPTGVAPKQEETNTRNSVIAGSALCAAFAGGKARAHVNYP
jgi:hypothetical protein